MTFQTQLTRNIKAIFLDLGNTLRVLVKDPDHMAQARCRIVELLDSDQDPVAFCQELDTRYKTYRKWAFENMAEASEADLWTRWLVPEFPVEKVAPLGAELTFQFRQSMGRRVVVDGGRDVVDVLHRRGYTLGIISNLIGTREIPDWLEADGFAPYFKAVALSSILGHRKPNPAIYLEAARLAGVEPAHCVYVGDNPKRDVVGTRQSGFGMIILIMTPEKLAEEPIALEHRPDLIIHEFCQLLDIFPGVADARS
ncbi:MAG: HAD family hydrolase [Anaerolineales bacterium]|nr:HAD family hydrolase [Anaerolineales bacterium]